MSNTDNQQTLEQLQSTLDLLGVTREQLESKVVDGIVERLLTETGVDDWDDIGEDDSALWSKLQKRAVKAIDDKVEALASKHLDGNIHGLIDSIVLEETNRWGERTGSKSYTLVEYLVARADAYMRQPVDHTGKPTQEKTYGQRVQYTRMSHMVEKYLADRIAKAMTESLEKANSAIASGFEEVVKMNLKAIVDGIKPVVGVKVPKLR